jgi:hypothetical protein
MSRYWSIGCLCLLACLACNKPAPQQNQEQKLRDPVQEMRQVLLAFLGSTQFEGTDLRRQLTGSDARLVYYEPQQGNLYFLIEDSREKDPVQLYNLCLDTNQIVFADHVDGKLILDQLSLPENTGLLFRFAEELFRVDKRRRIRQEDYVLSLRELTDLSLNQGIYDGPILFNLSLPGMDPELMLNHSAPVAMSGEATLQRLIKKRIAEGLPQEAVAQQLLDLVSNEIDYEDNRGREVIMRPHEVLLRQKADCSGKVVLYASLLEQVNIPYLLVYFPDHICVAVAGDFPDKNQMSFVHEGQTYALAETTAEGFVIGSTQLSPPLSYQDVAFLQYPGKTTRLYDVKTRDSMDFVSATISQY